MKRMQKPVLAISFLLSLSVQSIAADPSLAPSPWMGEYTQTSEINFTAAEDAKACRLEAPDAQWTGQECIETKPNKIDVSKISDLDNQFFVQVKIIGGNIHSCDFAGTMVPVGDKLVYEDVIPDQKELCRIELSRDQGGLRVVAADSCSAYYCGFGLSLSGTHRSFKRTGEGQEISKRTAQERQKE